MGFLFRAPSHKQRLREAKRGSMLRMLHLESLPKLTSHIFLMGASGSGKSSLLKLLMRELLNSGLGCVWFSVKSSEPEEAIAVIKSTQMRNRLIHLVPGQFTFNVASYEMSRPGGSPASFARLLERLNEMLNRQSSGGEDGSFWKGLYSAALEHASTICWLAYRDKVTLEHIYDLINACPANEAQLKPPKCKESKFYLISKQAEDNAQNPAEWHAVTQAINFFCQRVVHIGDKARGAMVTSCSNVIGPLMRHPVYETLCSSTSTFVPEMALEGNCVVIDYPILMHGTQALLFQNLLSIMITECALRNHNPTHVTVLLKDEYQLLCASPEFDSMAMSVARSHGICNIAATQSLPILRVAMGGDQQGEQFALSLLGNFNTQIVFANQCSETCQYYSRAWGEHREEFLTVNESKPEDKLDLMTFLFGPDRFLFSVSHQMTARCPVESFINLRRGGHINKRLVDAYLTQGGLRFGPDGSPFKKITFQQK